MRKPSLKENKKRRFHSVSGIFEKGQDWGSKLVVFTKGNEDKTTCNALDLFAVTDMEALIISRVSRYKFFDDSLSTIFGDPAKTVKPSYNDVSGTVSKFSLRDLMSLSGVVVYERCKSKYAFNAYTDLYFRSGITILKTSSWWKRNGWFKF